MFSAVSGRSFFFVRETTFKGTSIKIILIFFIKYAPSPSRTPKGDFPHLTKMELNQGYNNF